MNLILYFTADYCSPCQAMKPAFIDLMQEQGLKYEIVDVMENKEARQKYKVMGVPTIIVTNDGEIVGRVTGSRSREQLLKLIKGE